jgi:hypothetical protein
MFLFPDKTAIDSPPGESENDRSTWQKPEMGVSVVRHLRSFVNPLVISLAATLLPAQSASACECCCQGGSADMATCRSQCCSSIDPDVAGCCSLPCACRHQEAATIQSRIVEILRDTNLESLSGVYSFNRSAAVLSDKSGALSLGNGARTTGDRSRCVLLCRFLL